MAHGICAADTAGPTTQHGGHHTTLLLPSPKRLLAFDTYENTTELCNQIATNFLTEIENKNLKFEDFAVNLSLMAAVVIHATPLYLQESVSMLVALIPRGKVQEFNAELKRFLLALREGDYNMLGSPLDTSVFIYGSALDAIRELGGNNRGDLGWESCEFVPFDVIQSAFPGVSLM